MTIALVMAMTLASGDCRAQSSRPAGFEVALGPGWIEDMVRHPGGGVLVARRGIKETGAKLSILHIDDGGALKWEKTFEDGGIVEVGGLSLTPQDRIVVAGFGLATRGSTLWIKELSLAGEVLAESDVPAGGRAGAPLAFLGPSSFVHGTAINVITGQLEQSIYVTGTDGRSLARWHVPGMNLGSGVLVASRPDRKTAFVALDHSIRDADAGVGDSIPFVALVDDQLRQMWTLRIAADTEEQPNVSAVGLVADGGVALAGLFNSNKRAEPGWVAVVDAEGKQVWSRRFGRGGLALPRALVWLGNDASLAIGGCDASDFKGAPDTRRPLLIRIGAGGRSEQSIELKGILGGRGFIRSLVSLDDGRLAAAGVSGAGCGEFDGLMSGTDTWIVVLDSDAVK
ncbi:MAG TPA: hypothetical protein PK264_01675 [Hyphomicrobiaceae bacterium]|nr:hypothetical protein [Hyphomicrobiaceae bacterium]